MADYNFPRDFSRSSSRGSGSSFRGRGSGSSRGSSSRSSYGGFGGGYSEEKPTVTLDRDTLKSLNLLFSNVNKRNEEDRLADIKEKKRLAEEKEKKDTEAIEKITKELLAKIEKSGETMEEAVKRNTKSKELQKAIISMSSYIKQQEEAKKEEETKKKGFRHMTTKRYDKDNLDQLRQDSIKKAFQERKEQDLENKAMQKAMKEVMAFSKKTKMSTEKSMEALGISEHLREPLQEKIDEKKEGGGFIKQMTGKISEIKDAIMEGFEAHDVAIKGAIFGPLNLLMKPMEEFFGPFVKGFKNLFGHKKKDVFKQKPGRNDVVKTADMGALFIADTLTKLLGPKDEETGKRKGGFISKTKDNIKGFFKNVGGKFGSLFHKKSNGKNTIPLIKKENPNRNDIVKTADMGALYIADTIQTVMGKKEHKRGDDGGLLCKLGKKLEDLFGGITKKVLGLVGGLASGLLGKIFGGFLKKAGVSSIGELMKKAVPKIAESLVAGGPMLAAIGIGLLAAYGLVKSGEHEEKLKQEDFAKLTPDQQKALKNAGITAGSSETTRDFSTGLKLLKTPVTQVTPVAGSSGASLAVRNLQVQRIQQKQEAQQAMAGDAFRKGNYWKKTGANDYSFSTDGGNTWSDFGTLNDSQAQKLMSNLSALDRTSMPQGGTPKDTVDGWFTNPNNPDGSRGMAKFAKGGLVIPKPGNTRGIPAMIAEHGKPEAVFNGKQLDKILEGSLGSVEITRLLNELVSINDQGNKTNKEIQLTEEKTNGDKGLSLGSMDLKDTNKKLDSMITLLQKLVDKKITVNTPRQTHQDLVGILSGGGLY